MKFVQARQIRRLSTVMARLAIPSLLGATTIFGGVSAAQGAPQPRGRIGAGVGATPLQLPSAVHPGRTYRFPALYVKNTGNQTSAYRVRVQRMGSRPGRPVPVSWLRLSRTHLQLRPRGSALIPVTLVLPKTAGAGDYRTDLVFGTSSRRLKRGAALGAAAADDLLFTVAGPSGFQWPVWPVYLLLALTAAGLIVIGFRRTGLKVNIERR